MERVPICIAPYELPICLSLHCGKAKQSIYDRFRVHARSLDLRIAFAGS